MKEIMLPNSDPKIIGDALILLSEPNNPLILDTPPDETWSQYEVMIYTWKMAHKHYLGGNGDIWKSVIFKLALMLMECDAGGGGVSTSFGVFVFFSLHNNAHYTLFAHFLAHIYILRLV